MRKNKGKMISVLATLALTCTIALAGCGSVSNDETVVTINGETISYGVANFYTKMQQGTYEAYYGSLFGDDMWSQTIDGTTSFGDSTKESVLTELEDMLLLKQNASEYGVELTEDETAAIETAAQQFIADNDENTLKVMSADETVIKDFLTLYTYNAKVDAAIRAQADTNVTDEEAAQRTISYVFFSTAGETDDEGNTTELTDDEKTAIKDQAQSLVDTVNGGTEFDTAVSDAGLTSSSASYGQDDDADLEEDIITAADALSENETSNVIEVDSGYYVVYLVSEYDEEASATRKEEIISERQDELYTSVLEELTEAAEITVDDKLWSKVEINGSVTISDGTEETTDETTTEETTDETTTEDTTTEEVTDETTTEDTSTQQ